MQTEHDYISRKEIVRFLDQLEVISEKLHDEIVESAVDATIGAIRKLVGLAKEQDVVPVVRCGECRFWTESSAIPTIGTCMFASIRHTAGFFCANGERKDGDENG